MCNKLKHKNLLLICTILLLIFGCSRKKDKFLNRSFHSITTKYNYLYNGNKLFQNAIEDLNEQEKDNFWELLPLEKYQSVNIQEGNENKTATAFANAEEKAVLAIQKHSMNIKGNEENPIMDKAYLLLGKARYYDTRLIPSLEAFNYILYRYPSSKLINQTKIWKEKINIRLGQNERAIENLKNIIIYNNLEDHDLAQANIFLAQAYINTMSQDSAIQCLKTARNLIKEKPIKARYNYILGQLYDNLKHKDSANDLYAENINYKRKIPREYFIHSQIRIAANSDSIANSVMQLNEFIENIENRPFLGALYHQRALLNLKSNNDSLAVSSFNKSLEAIIDDQYLQRVNYQKIAETYFNNKKYLLAGIYYDSTLTKFKNRTKTFKTICSRLF